MLIPALLVTLSLGGEVHLDQDHGFQIEVPDGWRTSGQDIPGKGFVLTLLPPGSMGQKGVSVTVFELASPTDEKTYLAAARARIEAAGEEFSNFEEWEDELAGRAAPGIRVDYESPMGAYHIVQSFFIDGESGFMVQRHAPVGEFEEYAEDYEAVADSFALAELSEEGLAARRLDAIAERCGSEVDWARSWEQASERARAERRLILVATMLLPGFDIATTPRTTVFADEDIIELVNERFVPLWYERGMEAAFVESYGISQTAFGQALLLVTPDGEVLLETQASSNPDVAYAFLRAGLERHPGFTGPIAQEPEPTAAERARTLIARGDLASALEVLADDDSAAAQRTRARVFRLLQRGDEALAAIAAARAAGGEPAASLMLEEAELLMRMGRDREALEALDRVLATTGPANVIESSDRASAPGNEDPADAQANVFAKAQLLRGLMDLRLRDREAARTRWRALADGHPENRFAWQAAALLHSPALDLDVRPDLGWPDAQVMSELLTFPESAPLSPDDADEAARTAVAWLVAAQRENGSWRSPTEIGTNPDLGAEPFVDSITALCGSALLRHAVADDGNGARAAAERALAFLLRSIESRKTTPPVVLYMDYMTWSDSMMLAFLADAREAGIAGAAELGPVASALVDDMARRQYEDGGWSYYVTGDLDGSSAPAQSISFTTAAGVLALVRAREAGFEVPDSVLDPAVSALGRMRDEEGVFAYFLYHETGTAPAATAPPGAVGRGPACELALLRAGASDRERLEHTIDRFLAHAPLFAAEQGKVLMHAGPDAQGCHYLFFDYAHAALAQEALGEDPRTRIRLLELVLDCRQPDGSFVDTPMMGRAYGTAMALVAFDALAPGR